MKLPPGYVPGKGVQKATAYGGFGERLMKQMGWQDGNGLGRDQKGIKKAIQVKLKDDTIGVGSQPGYAWEKKWWEEAYDSKAKKMQASAETSDSDDSDDDVIVAVNRDGTRSSAHSHERKIAAALAKDPWGRFGGREGKMARIARQEAEVLDRLKGGQGASTSQPDSRTSAAAVPETQTSGGAAAAGADRSRSAGAEREGKGLKAEKRKQAAEEPAAEQEAGPKARRKKRSASARAAEESPADSTEQQGIEAEMSGNRKGKKQKRVAGEAEQSSLPGKAASDDVAPSQRQVHVVRIPQDDSLGSAPFRSTPASGWWGAARFRSAGCLEGLEHTAEHVKKERQSFTEQTQEDLYTATQAAKTSAKKGLGTASMPRKVAGARWQGTKTLIEENDAEAGPVDTVAAEGRAEEPICLQNAKWKKLAKAALLETSDRSMSAKRLKQAVVKAALAKEGRTASKAERKALQEAMLAKVSGSSMFAVDSGIIRLL